MSSEATERAAVKTYVPAYQKEEWRNHAEELDMSLSEFVRSMVQAGRNGFTGNTEDGGSADVTPGGEALEDTIRDELAEGPKSFDDLVAAIRGDTETRLDSLLQEASDIKYSGRHGGYVLEGTQT